MTPENSTQYAQMVTLFEYTVKMCHDIDLRLFIHNEKYTTLKLVIYYLQVVAPLPVM